MARFNYRVVKSDSSWTAEIIRKKTAKEMVVTLKKEGFATEDEAKKWGESELVSFVTALNKRNHQP